MANEAREQYQKRWYQEHKKEINAQCREYYQEHKEEVRKQARIYSRQFNKKLKSSILTHYGNNTLHCVVCGESKLPCLSIDHMNGNGSQHRRELRKRGIGFYRWLRDNNYPEGYQTLCMNCQFMKKWEEEEY